MINQSNSYPTDYERGYVKTAQSQNGGAKGHSKPNTGGKQAGPPPPPQPAKK